ncbi:MAG: class I SAM-dependent methyltransferase [Acidimicrobiia bacterium]
MGDRPDAAMGTDAARLAFQETRRAFWDRVWSKEGKSFASRHYHRRLSTIYRFIVPEGSSVLELGCGQGDLLAELRPKDGMGVDFSGQALEQARARHSALRFVEGDVHDTPIDKDYDVVVLSDLINDVWDVQQVMEAALGACRADSRLVLNFFNRAWQLPIGDRAQRRLTTTPAMAATMTKSPATSVRNNRSIRALTASRPVLRSDRRSWMSARNAEMSSRIDDMSVFDASSDGSTAGGYVMRVSARVGPRTSLRPL